MMLQQCQELRRLVMDGCERSVFHPITYVSHNLSILACNYEGSDVPELQKAKDENGNGTGLSMLYTGRWNIINYSLPTAAIYPLLYKNMKSLKIIHCYLSEWSLHDQHYFLRMYPNFKLEKLVTLKTSWQANTLLPFLLQQITSAEMLVTLSVTNIGSINGLVDLIMNLRRPPKTLQLHKIIDGSLTDTASYIRLIERYKKPFISLNCLVLDDCSGVTDSVLSSLSKLNSLNNVAFLRLNLITNSGIQEFMSTCSEKLSRITLVEMNSITNEVLTTLRRFDRLSYLGLESLRYATDQGIQGLVDEKVNFKLAELSIKKCRLVTHECIIHLKNKVKTVVYET